MKKTLIAVVAVFALLLVFTSAQSTAPADGKVGSVAPNISLRNAHTAFSLQQMRGKYVLLSFWSSQDAQSRFDNAQYEQAALDNDIAYVGINFDPSEVVFNEILKIDRLKSNSQFRVAGNMAEMLSKSFHLENHYATYLISPQGEVISRNPSVDELAKI